MTTLTIKAEDIELGDYIEGQRVTGWYFDGRGAAMIEYGGRWHRHRGPIDIERA